MRYPLGKISISLIVTCLVATSFVYAQQSDRYDCSTIGSSEGTEWIPEDFVGRVEQIFEDDENAEQQVFTDKDLKTAFTHLQQFCCESNNSVEGCEQIEPNGNRYAQSPFIFDHLVSIGMRKLDGKEDQCEEFGIDCEFRDGYRDHIDRREKITEIAEDTEGHPSSVLEGHFREYWGDQGTQTEESLVSNRYADMCDEAVFITMTGGLANQQARNGPQLAARCKALKDARYAKEATFVRTLMVEKGILYQSQNLRAYLGDYFTNTRLSGLLEKYATLDGCFAMVLRYVNRTDCCNE